jgi:hypothetical protein
MTTRRKLKTVTLRIKISENLHESLGVLAQETELGASENDVALHLVTERVRHEMAELRARKAANTARNTHEPTEQK